MSRRQPVIRDRGVSVPPPGYRPGLKARWLHPRPIHTNTPPEEAELQLTSPTTVLFSDVPANGDTLALAPIPANSIPLGLISIINTLWDDAGDSPRYAVSLTDIYSSQLEFAHGDLWDATQTPGVRFLNFLEMNSLPGTIYANSSPLTPTFSFITNGAPGAASAGSITLRIAYSSYNP